MEVSEAREHLQIVDRIIAASSRKLEVGGEFFVYWGIAGAAMDIVGTLIVARRLAPSAIVIGFALLAAAALCTVLRARYYRERGDGLSLLQREYFKVMWLAMGMALLANLLAYNLFSAMAQPAIWSLVEAVVLLYIGMHGNRRAQIGGIVLVASIVVANFTPFPVNGFVLAGGMLLGYAGFGVADLLARE